MRLARSPLPQLMGVLLASAPLSALAGNCDANGSLYYLGNTSNASNSVWISATSAGSFRLDAAQGNTTVDQWSKANRGLNLSLSPFVSNGNGGTHKLYDTTGNKDCLLDTQNQKAGITLPPHITFPNLKPPGLVVPPIGKLFPGFSTLTPMLPGGVKPPIGTLPKPPTGIMPTLPGGVRPPIGTLPPVTGITPIPAGRCHATDWDTAAGRRHADRAGRRAHHRPAPLPPVASRRPSAPCRRSPASRRPCRAASRHRLGPCRPAAASCRSRRPCPGGVTPPIGTLPPVTGVTPTCREASRHRSAPCRPAAAPCRSRRPSPGRDASVGTLPPGAGGGVTVAPAIPGTVTAPVGRTPPPANATTGQGALLPRDDRQLECIDPRNRAAAGASANNLPDCEPPKPLCPPDQCQAVDFDVPITPGRDLGVGLQPNWNLWTDVRFLSTTDGRYGLDVTGSARTATVGLDRKVSSDVVVGFTVSLEDSSSTGYGGFFQSKARGITVGPYAAYAMSPNWAIDAALGYNRSSNDLGLAMMDGTFLSQRLSGAVNLHGQYDLGFVAIRPRLSASYSRTFSDAYNLNGTLFRQAIGVLFPSADYDYGTLEGAVEINRMFTTSGGTRIMPYAEFGSVFEYTRPNGGQILTSDLQLATPSPWAFTVRSGVRMLLTDTILLEASAGYLSFGQNGLDVIEARVHVSFSF